MTYLLYIFLLQLFLLWSPTSAMENAPPGSATVDQQASLFGHFAKAEGIGTGVSVPFDKNMAYAITWVPTRKILMINGFDPLTPKPFTTAKLHTAGLQHKSYYLWIPGRPAPRKMKCCATSSRCSGSPRAISPIWCGCTRSGADMRRRLRRKRGW